MTDTQPEPVKIETEDGEILTTDDGNEITTEPKVGQSPSKTGLSG
jgi:hypothetical protein